MMIDQNHKAAKFDLTILNTTNAGGHSYGRVCQEEKGYEVPKPRCFKSGSNCA